MDIPYDSNLPFAIIEGEKSVIARFMNEDDARLFANEEGLDMVDTTPTPLPTGIGAVVAIPNSMPLICVFRNEWVMPMQTSSEQKVGTHRLASPLGYGKYHFTDDEVRSIIALKGGEFTGVNGFE